MPLPYCTLDPSRIQLISGMTRSGSSLDPVSISRKTRGTDPRFLPGGAIKPHMNRQPYLRVCVWRSPIMGLVSPTLPAHVASLSRSEAMPPREAPRLLLNGMEKNPLHGHGGRRPRGLREFRESTRRACVRPYWHVLCCVGFSTRGTKTARGVSFGTNMQGEPSS